MSRYLCILDNSTGSTTRQQYETVENNLPFLNYMNKITVCTPLKTVCPPLHDHQVSSNDHLLDHPLAKGFHPLERTGPRTRSL